MNKTHQKSFMSAQTSLLHLLSWYHLSYLTNKGASTIKHHQPSNTKMNTTATIPEIKISTFIYPKLPKNWSSTRWVSFTPTSRRKSIHSSNNFGFPTASPPWIHADLGSAGTWCNIIPNPVIVRQSQGIWDDCLKLTTLNQPPGEDHGMMLAWIVCSAQDDAGSGQKTTIQYDRNVEHVYSTLFIPLILILSISFEMIDSLLDIYIYIDRGTPPPSPTSLSIASWRRNTSWCFTNPLRLEQNPSKLGSVPLQRKNLETETLCLNFLSMYSVERFCWYEICIWKKKHHRWWELTSDSMCLVQELSARLNTSNCFTC